MGVELHDDICKGGLFQFLLNFRQVAMARHAVALYAFVALAVEEVFRQLTSCATDSTVAVDHDAGSLDESRL